MFNHPFPNFFIWMCTLPLTSDFHLFSYLVYRSWEVFEQLTNPPFIVIVEQSFSFSSSFRCNYALALESNWVILPCLPSLIRSFLSLSVRVFLFIFHHLFFLDVGEHCTDENIVRLSTSASVMLSRTHTTPRSSNKQLSIVPQTTFPLHSFFSSSPEIGGGVSLSPGRKYSREQELCITLFCTLKLRLWSNRGKKIIKLQEWQVGIEDIVCIYSPSKGQFYPLACDGVFDYFFCMMVKSIESL